MERTRSSLIPITLLTLTYVLLVFLLFSFKQYPLDDDWSYVRAAEVFHNTGQIRFTDWTAMSLLFQLWLGTGFTLLFGYSIELLRLSTLFISLIGLIFFYFLLREVGLKWHLSLLALSLFLFNPLSFPLLFTFFSDHHFISLLVVSTFLYYKAFIDNNNTYLLLGSLSSSCAILVRQNGILIPVSVIICLMVRQLSLKTFLWKAAVASFLPLITIILFNYWLSNVHGIPSEMARQTTALVNRLAKPQLFLSGIVSRTVVILEFVGFSLIPLSLSMMSRLKMNGISRRAIIVLLCSVGLIYILLETFDIRTTSYLLLKGFPYAFLSEYGVREVPGYLHVVAAVGTVLSVTSMLYIVFLIFSAGLSIHDYMFLRSPVVVISVIGGTQLLTLFFGPQWIPRYSLVLLPFFILLALVIGNRVKINQTLFIIFLIPYFLSSFAITQDFMNWNQTKWKCADELLKKKNLRPNEISAGFAWDCWHNWFYSHEHQSKVVDGRYEIPWWIRKLVPVVEPRYLISNTPKPTRHDGWIYYQGDEWRAIHVVQYFSAFYARKMNIFVLEKE